MKNVLLLPWGKKGNVLNQWEGKEPKKTLISDIPCGCCKVNR